MARSLHVYLPVAFDRDVLALITIVPYFLVVMLADSNTEIARRDDEVLADAQRIVFADARGTAGAIHPC